jgi:hypothetical protein
MNQEQGSLLCSLRRQHHLLWLFLGVGFALFFCSRLVQMGASSLGLLIGLLAVYWGAGHWAAQLVARLVSRSQAASPGASLLTSSIKVGGFLSILSTLFHLALLVALDRLGALAIRAPTSGPILLRAAALPFLACLGAACTVLGTAGTKSSTPQRDKGVLPAAECGPSSLPRPARRTDLLANPSHRPTSTNSQDERQ